MYGVISDVRLRKNSYINKIYISIYLNYSFAKIHQNNSNCFLKFLGILQGIYWGLGTGTGAIVGGFLVHHVGGDIAFRAFSIATATVFSLFVLIQLVLRYAGRDALDYHKLPTQPHDEHETTEEASEEDEEVEKTF